MSTTPRDLEGRTYLVTGTNAGIGRITAGNLARRGAEVFVTARTMDKARDVAIALRAEAGHEKVKPLALDLTDLASVRACAQAFKEAGRPLHGLIANAGLAGQRGQTKDGFELAFGVNHLGHYLLVRSLIDVMKSSTPSRIVMVASRAHYQAKALDLSIVQRSTATVSGVPEYSVSKLANVLFANELARRLSGTGVTTYSLHPGVVATEIWRRIPWPLDRLVKLFMISPEEGAKTQTWCATEPSLAQSSGLYYDHCAEKRPSRLARDEALAKVLWEQSADWVGLPREL